MKYTILGIIGLMTIWSCDINNEREKLRVAKDSLEAELIVAKRAVSALDEVGKMMDSIDSNRDAIRLDMQEGLQYDEYVDRMKDLNEYVKRSEKRIKDLEMDLHKSEATKSTYATAISRLKNDLAKKNEEIIELQKLVEDYKSENTELLSLVELKESQLADAEIDIMQKKQELNLLETRIQELMIEAKMTEADAYYARAAAVEEAANRTKLAPRKKKDTYQEALDLYKKALEKGREDAQAKIDELKEKV